MNDLSLNSARSLKLLFITVAILLCNSTALEAHNLWIEVAPNGQIGQSQQVDIYYGEYPYDYYEQVDDNFRDVEDFALWMIAPDGTEEELKPRPGNHH